MTDDRKTDVWMPIWIGAYTADTMDLTTLQHGAYLLLLLNYWRKRCALPDNDETLRAITKMERAEWKRNRPVLAAFFKVADGVWWHKRVEAEIVEADKRAAAATSKAKLGAEARWKKSNKDGAGNATSSATGNAPSMPRAMPESAPKQCPPPSPINTNTLSSPADDRPPPAGAGAPTHTHEAPPLVEPQAPAPPPAAAIAPTPAAALCRQLKALGFSRVNPGNQRLQMLLDAGATPDEFMAHTAKALEHGDEPFAFLLGIVEGERKRVARVAGELHRGPMPARQAAAPPPQSFRERDQEAAMRRWEEATGRVHPDRAQPPLQFPAVAQAADVIDMEPAHPALEHDDE